MFRELQNDRVKHGESLISSPTQFRKASQFCQTQLQFQSG
jgi:hypothetical protein